MNNLTPFHVAGIRLDATVADDVSERTVEWCRNPVPRPRTVCFVNAFSIVSAARDASFARAINDSDLSVADGAPVAWLGQVLARQQVDRLSGPDLMHHLLTDPACSDLRHFIYGGSQDALDRLEFRYNRAGIGGPKRIVGTFSPPFRELSQAEEQEFVDRLEKLQPHILWVCLGTARQEKWMARMRDRLHVPLMAGVGAAVDFLSGSKARAPRWMQRLGLEWLFRFATEPHRLWRRYLVGNVVFLRFALIELWHHRGAPGDSA